MRAGAAIAAYLAQLAVPPKVTRRTNPRHAIRLGERSQYDNVLVLGYQIRGHFASIRKVNVRFVDHHHRVLRLVSQQVFDVLTRRHRAARIIGIANVVSPAFGSALIMASTSCDMSLRKATR